MLLFSNKLINLVRIIKLNLDKIKAIISPEKNHKSRLFSKAT